MKKKQIVESFINSIFNELTWQKVLVVFLTTTTQNLTANQLNNKLQQLYCPIIFCKLSDEFTARKILHALDLSGGTC